MLITVSGYCTELLQTYCGHYPFHNLAHTEQVFANVQTIGQLLDTPSEELGPVIIAAWFHDTGFKEAYSGHEAVSIRFAQTFLRSVGYAEEKLAIVVNCI